METMIYSPEDQDYANVMFDHFYYKTGGNCFDTAYVYNKGQSETALGNWVQQRKLRDQVVIIGKTGAVNTVTPDLLVQ